MNKPWVFNYREHEELKEKYEQLQKDYNQLRIRCRIAEAMVKELKDDKQQREG